MAGLELWLAEARALADAATQATLDSALSEAERASARRFYFPADACAYRGAHAALRLGLSARFRRPAPDFTFQKGPEGKPSLEGAPRGFDFNLSHCRPASGIAVSAAGPVGFDVEGPRERRELEAAVRWFSAGERERLSREPDDAAWARHALVLWTLKEALLKAEGLGLNETRLQAMDASWEGGLLTLRGERLQKVHAAFGLWAGCRVSWVSHAPVFEEPVAYALTPAGTLAPTVVEWEARTRGWGGRRAT